MFGWLAGYRTYIAAAALVGVSVAHAFGVPIPYEVDTAIIGTGLAALRASV